MLLATWVPVRGLVLLATWVLVRGLVPLLVAGRAVFLLVEMIPFAPATSRQGVTACYRQIELMAGRGVDAVGMLVKDARSLPPPPPPLLPFCLPGNARYGARDAGPV